MKKSFLFFAALAAILSLSSCKKDFTATPESGQNETSRQPARITVSVQGAPVTKADIATRNNEDRLNTVEVYVFDAQTGSITNGMLESYKKAEDAEILGEQHNNAKVTFNATTGKKHIYVVANAGNNYAVTPAAALAQTITTEEEFLAVISRFNENAIASGSVATSLLMVGGSENVLTQGENNIDISLRRLVARVKIEKITGQCCQAGQDGQWRLVGCLWNRKRQYRPSRRASPLAGGFYRQRYDEILQIRRSQRRRRERWVLELDDACQFRQWHHHV